MPPTTTNSTFASASRTMTSSNELCTRHNLLHKEAPTFVSSQPLGRGQRQAFADLREIHVPLMAQVVVGLQQFAHLVCDNAGSLGRELFESRGNLWIKLACFCGVDHGNECLNVQGIQCIH